MKFRAVTLLAVLVIGTVAHAGVKTIVAAVETSTAFMTVPTTVNSKLIFKSCEECDYVEVRLTPETQFFVRGVALSFPDFRRAFNGLPRSREDYALVSYETESNTVTSIRVGD